MSHLRRSSSCPVTLGFASTSLPRLLATASLLAAGWLAIASPLTAQAPPPASEGDDVRVVLEDRVAARLRLAFPRLEKARPMSDEVSLAAEELERTLREDLDETRVFDIQGPWALQVLQLTGDPQRDLIEYRSLGNQLLLLTSVRDDGGRLVFEGRVIDVTNGESVLGKRYRGTTAAARRIAHTFADEMLYFLTGLRGIALTEIAFVSNRSGNKEVYVMDYDGRNQRAVTSHRSISMAPEWHPRNSGLLYLSYYQGRPGLYFAELPSGAKRPVVSDDAQNFSAALSPDGRTVAFGRSLSGNVEIFTANFDGSGLRRLTRTGSIDTNPAWSPDGSRLAFTSGRTGRPMIYVMNADGSESRRVTFDGEYNDGAAWHPTQPRLVYASRRNGTFQIAVTDFATNETYTLTSGPGDKEHPAFSPDGRRIAYSHKRSGRTQIFVIDADGSNLKQLTQDGNNFSPNWSYYPPERR